MIEEDYVSFETAKLLKEKGFNEKCNYVYMWTGNIVAAQYFMEGESFVDNEDIDAVAKYNEWIIYTQGEYAYLCPTIQRAMKWLRKEHFLHVHIGYDDLDWFWDIMYVSPEVPVEDRPEFVKEGFSRHKEYEDAALEGIKYCLENLI